MPTARVKRILANRQSAARSKERKLAYIGELESQVSPKEHQQSFIKCQHDTVT
jgi:Basic region leucine zipper